MNRIILKIKNLYSKEDLKMFSQVAFGAIAYLSALFVVVIVYIEYFAGQ